MHKKFAILALVSTFFATGLFLSPGVHAQLNVCNPPQTVFQKIQDSFDRNIRETAVNHLTSALMDWIFNLVTGTEMKEYMGCTTYVAANTTDPEISNKLSQANCSTTSEAVCQNIVNQYVYDTNGRFDREKFANGKVAGSALGIAYSLDNSIMYEPLPVNTAYFFKDYAYKIPVIGDKVLAADDEVDYRHNLIGSVLGIWKITRNAAYAIMALIMLYVGLAIIMRKQISQKMVVTIQYSLPKIALALVLIAFSYPIGALMTSLAWSLYYSAESIVTTLGAASGAVDPTFWTGAFKSIGGIGILILLVILSFTGVGIGLVALVTVLFVVVIGLNIIATFKALMLFLKMLIGIITAPIEFAVGAIPGNESKTMDWFKRMAAHGLGIFGIAVTIKLVHMFGVTAIRDSFTDNAFAGSMFAIFGFIFIFIYGYTFAIKVPNMIESAIMGPPKRK